MPQFCAQNTRKKSKKITTTLSTFAQSITQSDTKEFSMAPIGTLSGACRVEKWRGGSPLGYSVSTPRSSNRTCGFPASGSRTKVSFMLSHTGGCVLLLPVPSVQVSYLDTCQSRFWFLLLCACYTTTGASVFGCGCLPRGRLCLLLRG